MRAFSREKILIAAQPIDANGRYAGGDIYLYDVYHLEEEHIEKDKQDTTELKQRIEAIRADAEDKKTELNKLKPILAVLKKEKDKKDKAKQASQKGAVIYERAQMVRARRAMTQDER